MKYLLLILSLWIFSFSLFAQQSDCKYMKGQLVVKAILHPTCFAACNGQLSVGMGVSGGLEVIKYYIDGQKSFFKGLFLDICPGRHTIIAEMEMDGCRDTLHVLMTPLDSTHTTLEKTICNGQSYVLNNEILTKSGTYQAAFPRKNTCDSAVVLHLKVLASDTVRVEKTVCKGSTGIDTMVLKKSNGCDSVIILTVKSAKDPNITITEQNKLLMINLPLSSVIYQWFLDEKAILGATNSSFTAISDGVYYLEITDLNACKFKSNSITIKKSSTSDAMQENIRIAPNPMQEQVTISADFDIEKVEITNAMGQILFSQNVANQSITINTVAFAKGVYFAKIYRNKKEFKILILKKQT